MIQRPVLIALGIAGALLAPTAAIARDGESEIDHAARKLDDPQNQLAVAAAAAAMSQTILDIRVEPLVRAMRSMGDDGARDLPPDATIGDVAGPGAQRLPRQIARNVPRAMGSASQMAGSLREMLPELKAAAKRLRDSLPDY